MGNYLFTEKFSKAKRNNSRKKILELKVNINGNAFATIFGGLECGLVSRAKDFQKEW